MTTRRADLAKREKPKAQRANYPYARYDDEGLLPTTSIKSRWTLAEIRAAVDAHVDGNFAESAMLIEALLRVGRIGGCLETRVSSLIARGTSAQFSVSPPEGFGEDATAKSYVDKVKPWYWQAVDDCTHRALVEGKVMAGVSYGRRRVISRGGTWHVKLEPWPLHHLSFNESAHVWRVHTRKGVVEFDETSRDWYIFKPYGPRSHVRGAVCALSEDAGFHDFAKRDWARFCEKHGLPILSVEEPEQSGQDPRQKSFFTNILRMGAEGYARLPQRADGKGGYKLAYVEPKNSESYKAFKEFIEYLESVFTIRIKGSNLTTEVKGGSFAATVIHADVDLLMTAGDGQDISGFTRPEVIVPWGLYNVADFDVEKAPWAGWDCRPKEDAGTAVGRMKAYGEGVGALRKEGIEPDIKKDCDRFDINVASILTPDELEAKRQADFERQAALAPAAPPKPGQPGAAPKPAAKGLPRPPKRAATGGRSLEAPPGAAAGQAYLDARLSPFALEAAAAVAGDVQDILGHVFAATDPGDLERRLALSYDTGDEAALAEVLTKALLLAELVGRYSLLADL